MKNINNNEKMLSIIPPGSQTYFDECPFSKEFDFSINSSCDSCSPKFTENPMSFINFFKRLLGTKAHPAHLPYIPTPPSHRPDASPPNQLPYNPGNTETSYTETEVNIHTIAGTNIGFGTQKVVQVDDRGQAKDFSQTQSHIVGSGKVVSKIEDIAGVCRYCQAEAAQAFEVNLISLEEAQIKSLYDTQSASRCDICGTNTCCRHCRPIQMPDGLTQLLCIDCQKQIKGQLLKKRIAGFLLAPFMENENPNER
jgi:hypothetical protein